MLNDDVTFKNLALELLKKDLSLALQVVNELSATKPVEELEDKFDFYEEVKRFEINLIKRALILSGWNQRKAAEMLGIKPSTLNNKIGQYAIRREEEALGEFERCDHESDEALCARLSNSNFPEPAEITDRRNF